MIIRWIGRLLGRHRVDDPTIDQLIKPLKVVLYVGADETLPAAAAKRRVKAVSVAARRSAPAVEAKIEIVDFRRLG